MCSNLEVLWIYLVCSLVRVSSVEVVLLLVPLYLSYQVIVIMFCAVAIELQVHWPFTLKLTMSASANYSIDFGLGYFATKVV